jgi:hypothetical protein
MSTSREFARRDVLKTAAFFAAGTSSLPGAIFARLGTEQRSTPRANATTTGRREIVSGLDGMSRVAEAGNDPFADGHVAAGVIAFTFFCRENDLEAATQETILSLVEARLLASPIFAPRPEEPADAELVGGLLEDLDAGIDSLRGSGHNIIFATASLKALREVPEAATPARIAGLRSMVQSFGARRNPGNAAKAGVSIPDLGDEKQFVRFVFEEYLRALDLYLAGQGHHGFAGHVLTIGHALVDLSRIGHGETARKGLAAFEQFIQQARAGADLGGRRVAAPPPRWPAPLQREYWVEQLHRPADGIVSSHLVKYPYSFYALLKDLPDGELKQRVLQQLYHLTAVS